MAGKSRIQLLCTLIVTGLFLLIGQVFADEPSQATIKQIRSSNKGHFATMSFGTYSTTGSSDRKTTIMSSDGKIIAEEIYSPNKRFYAFADIDKKITTIYEVIWQGNIGRRKKFWAMDGCFEMLGLLNDGEHLVVGYQGASMIPIDYKKDQVMLSFFKSGKLINQVRLNQLITNFSKLQRTDSGYYWGRYLGLNSAGYYVVEFVEGKKILFDVKIGKPIKFKSEKVSKLTKWKVYQDIMRCYEFQYPDSYLLEEHLCSDGTPAGWNFLKRKNKGWVIETSIESIADLPLDWYDPAKISFEDFVIDRARAMLCTDGPTGSRYTTDVVRKKVFTNTNKLKGLEFYLLEVHETYFEDMEEVKIEKRTIGPTYAISISQPDESYRVLYFLINDEEESFMQMKEILKKIVDTVRILR